MKVHCTLNGIPFASVAVSQFLLLPMNCVNRELTLAVCIMGPYDTIACDPLFDPKCLLTNLLNHGSTILKITSTIVPEEK